MFIVLCIPQRGPKLNFNTRSHMTNLVQKYANPKVETEPVEMRGIEAHHADRGPSQKDQLEPCGQGKSSVSIQKLSN